MRRHTSSFVCPNSKALWWRPGGERHRLRLAVCLFDTWWPPRCGAVPPIYRCCLLPCTRLTFVSPDSLRVTSLTSLCVLLHCISSAVHAYARGVSAGVFLGPVLPRVFRPTVTPCTIFAHLLTQIPQNCRLPFRVERLLLQFLSVVEHSLRTHAYPHHSLIGLCVYSRVPRAQLHPLPPPKQKTTKWRPTASA